MSPPSAPDSGESEGDKLRATEGRVAEGRDAESRATAGWPEAGTGAIRAPEVDRVVPDRAELGRLRWRCRRGLRELDELLTRYVDEQYATASASQQRAFRELLDSHDPVIYEYFMGRQTPAEPVLSSLIERITAGTAAAAGDD